ncbi:hypothetical protein COY95_02290 [Candidatus Woesearchaeota archaeon CG_4_10_14_0_8_um_filter_47_5]|nr:MAG: hypothetical protein COY95_02290 [Candidatus Woesearchaeota archaeon CG_4_10_14_0_8_um_filter_47_5]
MAFNLPKIPPQPVMIIGFPGFGLIGTITTEFLIDHLKTERVGNIVVDSVTPMIAIHDGKLIDPIGIHYNKKYNLIIIHGINPVTGIEWEVAQQIIDLAQNLSPKEILCIEGIGLASPETGEEVEGEGCYYYTNTPSTAEQLEAKKVSKLKEGIILGITSALLLKATDLPVTSIFAQTHSNLPDSKAAAKIIEVLDNYLTLNVDYQPLLQTAEKFETKLRNLIKQSQVVSQQRDKKQLSYVG